MTSNPRTARHTERPLRSALKIGRAGRAFVGSRHRGGHDSASAALGVRATHIVVDVSRRVILFSTDSCTFCVSAKSLLSKRGVVFEEVNLAEDPALQAELADLTGLTSFPQIIVDGETLGGLNELRAADKNGTLASWSAE